MEIEKRIEYFVSDEGSVVNVFEYGFGWIASAKGKTDRLWFDIETYKEPVSLPYPDGWPNNTPGCPLKNRMKTFMICVAVIEGGELVFRVGTSLNEAALLDWFLYCCGGKAEAAYCSFNDFDKLVLEGRYTNARRRKLVIPGPWPYICSRTFEWVNIKKNMRNAGTDGLKRGKEIGGADILKYGKNKDSEMVNGIAVHCLRDVAGAMMEDGDYKFNKHVYKRLESLFTQEFVVFWEKWDGNSIGN